MRTLLVAALAIAGIAGAAAPARADAGPRRVTLGVGLGISVDAEVDDPDYEARGDDPVAGLAIGAVIAYDRPTPPLPALPGYTIGGDVVPEGSVWRAGDDVLAFAALRLELEIAQREQGLLRVSARGSLWLAPRVGVVLASPRDVIERGPAFGGELGMLFALGRSSWSLGYAVSVTGWRERKVDDVPVPSPTPVGVVDDETRLLALVDLLLVAGD